MQVLSRHRALAALACLFTTAFAAQPLPAAAHSSPGTILFQRPMSGIYAGVKTFTGLAAFSIHDDGSGERQLTPFAQYTYYGPGLAQIAYLELWSTRALSPSGHFSVMLEAHSNYPLFGRGPYHGKYFIINDRGGRYKPLFPGNDDLEDPRAGPSYGSLAWGPEGTNKIAYANSQELLPHKHPACVRLMHPDGTGNHALWCAARWDYRGIEAIRWSGDGTKLLAYAVYTNRPKAGNPIADLFLIDVATGKATLVAAAVRAPYVGWGVGDVSYDGHEVVFDAETETNDPNCVPNSSEGQVMCAKNMLTGQTTALRDPDHIVQFPLGGQVLISPDGSQAFATGRTSAQGTEVLYAINTDGTGLRRINEPCVTPNEDTTVWWKPVRLSPDGKQMLANCRIQLRTANTLKTRIYIVNLHDGSSRYVTRGTAYDWHVPSA
ncbi:hypothetical protein [Frateuria sp. YIM B11624]|uniref:hypothetical protein n=1 Tax=Frateuria sp. YIM B11624 TaxID=3143185 RepID=UPI003C742E30